MWTVECRDPDGRVLRVAGFRDKAASQALGRRVARLADCKAAREPLDADLTQWIEGLPGRLRDRLAALNLLDASRVAAAKPLAAHLADWRVALLAKGCTVAHADLVAGRAARAFAGARALGDVTAERVRGFLADLLERGRSRQTHNFYRQAAGQFCRWAVREGRMSASPLLNVAALNV
ncbi:MAG TPA: hypothetical protein VM431_09510, partial [Phycisphaerae bacterium]|nr:hypothetical protein [Phycisphaerae bacterium]